MDLAELRVRAERADGVEAQELLAQARRLVNEAAAIELALVGKVERSGCWRTDPRATMNSWLRDHTNLDGPGAHRVLGAVHTLEQMPQLAKAADRGQVSREAIDVISSLGRCTYSRQQALPQFDELFTRVAIEQTRKKLVRVMKAFGAQVDPLAAAKDEYQAHDRREFHVRDLADGVEVQGFFSQEQGAKIRAALNAAVNQMWRGAGEDERKKASRQQRADAFVDGVCGAALASGGLPDSGGARPSVAVVVPLERLERPCQPASIDELRELAQADLPFVDSVATIGTNNGPGEALLSAAAAQRMACDCEVHRIVLSPEGVPLDVGRASRTFTKEQRKALVVRDKGCAFPGCERPPAWCEAHHIIGWALGGRTSVENGLLLCSAHHHDVHRFGDRITMQPGGKPLVELNRITRACAMRLAV